VIKSLFEKNYFDVCKLIDVMNMLHAKKGSPAYTMLHALHCVDYASMDPELRVRIPHLVNECLSSRDDVIEATDVALKGVF
jgi:hypothetical protein